VYKLLLCWRYLLTRYLALACIVSVMLGVATLIVVNSVMAGFSTKLRERLHGLLSDIVIEAADYEGFANPDGKMARIMSDPFLAPRIEAMTPTLEIFGMIRFNYRGTPIARPVRIIGIDPVGRARVGGFAEHLLLHPDQPSFELNARARERQRLLHQPHRLDRLAARLMDAPAPDGLPAPEPPPSREFIPPSIIVGYAVAHFRESPRAGRSARSNRAMMSSSPRSAARRSSPSSGAAPFATISALK
jgi:lipoprotein-releasing system permease protein